MATMNYIFFVTVNKMTMRSQLLTTSVRLNCSQSKVGFGCGRMPSNNHFQSVKNPTTPELFRKYVILPVFGFQPSAYLYWSVLGLEALSAWSNDRAFVLFPGISIRANNEENKPLRIVCRISILIWTRPYAQVSENFRTVASDRRPDPLIAKFTWSGNS